MTPRRGGAKPSGPGTFVDDVEANHTVRMSRPLLALGRMLLYLPFTLALMPVQAVAVTLGPGRLAAHLPQFYHRVCCRLFGIEIRVRGTVSADRPLLLISNHVSYLDIPVLSALAPTSFVAKAEVRNWPFFGMLARLQRTVFVDRRRASTAMQRDAITQRLAAGDVLVLFAEGTSSDGNRILPFKSALLSVAEKDIETRPLTVQPVSIAYTRLDGIPAGRNFRPYLAWYGDMDLGRHLWNFLGLGRTMVVVEFHQPLSFGPGTSRREIAGAAEDAVRHGVANALRNAGARHAVSEGTA